MMSFTANSRAVLCSVVLWFLPLGLLYGQNSVHVKQNGNGNKVTIKQGGNQNSSSKPVCDEIMKNSQSAKNRIMVKRVDGKMDTLINTGGHGLNIVSKILGSQQLNASQYGEGNGLSVVLPDSQKSYQHFNSTQQGSGNKTTARLNNIRNISLSQNGQRNSIAVNPCGENHEHSSQNNAIKVNQQGHRNAVNISQH